MDESLLVEPMSWHRSSWQQLCRRLHDDLLPHALLLRGQSGVGKRQFALAFAQYLLCLQKTEEQQACGHCRNCLLNRAGTHPDLLILEPEERGKQIKVAQVRHMIEFTEKTPQQGGYRVVVLCPAEAMNVSSANALLKCLEEPGQDTLMLLVSEQVSGLLPTIRSRCQQLLFSRPVEEEALAWLDDFVGNLESSRALLQLAAGEPVTALRYEREGLLEQWERMKSDLAALTRGKLSIAEIAACWQSFDIQVVLEWLNLWMQEMVRYRASGDATFLVTAGMEKMLRYIADKAGLRRLLQTQEWLIQQRATLFSQINLNRQLLLESVLGRWLSLSV